MKVTCDWALYEDDGFWEADCGFIFILNDGTPLENDMRFCGGCGKKLTVTNEVINPLNKK